MKVYMYLLLSVIGMFEEFPSVDSIDADRVQTLYTNLPFIKLSAFELLVLPGLLFSFLSRRLYRERQQSLILHDWRFRLLLITFFAAIVNGFVQGARAFDIAFEIRAIVVAFAVGYIVAEQTRSITDVEQILRWLAFLGITRGLWGVYLWQEGVGRTFGDFQIVFYDFGSLLLILLSMSYLVSRVLAHPSIRRVAYSIALSVPMVISFIFSFRRALNVAVGVGIFLVVVLYLKSMLSHKAFRVAVMLPLSLLVVYAIDQGFSYVALIREDPLQISTADVPGAGDMLQSDLFRSLESSMVVDNVLDSPFLGKGWGVRYSLTQPLPQQFEAFFYEVNMFVHDSHLEVLLKMGLIGLIAYLVFWGSLFKRMVKKCMYTLGQRANGLDWIVLFMSIVFFTMFFFGPQLNHIRTMCLVVVTTVLFFPLESQILPNKGIAPHGLDHLKKKC
jgi:hypothetical protein